MITAGGRADYFSLIGERLTFSPRVSAAANVGAYTKTNVGIGKYYQAPSYIWLLGNPENTKLSPISATHFIAGVEHNLREDTKLSLEGYIKTYDRQHRSAIPEHGEYRRGLRRSR
jgi:outer membrane receptor for ferrienterochelin and colicin